MYLSIYLSILQIQADLARPPAPTLQQNLENLFTHEHCPDFKLIYLNTVFNVHKSILLARYLQDFICLQGCILNLNSYFCPPPPSWFIFFPHLNVLWRGVARRRRKILSPFFAILYISNQLRKKYAYFLSLGEKNMHFPPFFYPLSIVFSPTCYLDIFLPNRKIYTPVCLPWNVTTPYKTLIIFSSFPHCTCVVASVKKVH